MPIVYDPLQFGGETTFEHLVDEIISNTQGFTQRLDAVTSLAEDLGLGVTEFTVIDPDNFSRGVVEVGDELVWVQKVDRDTGTLTLLPQGRGWRGTQHVTHVKGETVTSSPVLPRSVVKREIANQINALWPNIYAIKTFNLTVGDGLTVDWPLPGDAEAVLDVRWQDRLGNWQRATRWEVEHDLPDVGHALRFTDVPFQSPCQVVYGARPTPPSAGSQSLGEMGLTAGAKDIITYGVLARVLPMMDVSRLSVQTVAADEMDDPVKIGSAAALADQFGKLRDKALQRELSSLKKKYPARVHWVR